MCSCLNYATMVHFQRENIKCFKCIIYTLSKVLERSLALTSLLTNFKFEHLPLVAKSSALSPTNLPLVHLLHVTL